MSTTATPHASAVPQLVVAPLTPFTAQGEVDEAALSKELDYIVDDFTRKGIQIKTTVVVNFNRVICNRSHNFNVVFVDAKIVEFGASHQGSAR